MTENLKLNFKSLGKVLIKILFQDCLATFCETKIKDALSIIFV